MIPVLVLRAEASAASTIAKARHLGLEPIAVPLFQIDAVDWTAPDPASFNGLLLTSTNAVRFGGKQLRRLRGLQAFAVGESTAAAARDEGFDIAATGKSDVDRLLGSIEPDLKLLHLCGDHRRQPADERQRITPLVVYRAKEVASPVIPENFPAVALVHSPRAGTRLAQLAGVRGRLAVAAISEAAAEAVGGGWASVSVSDVPTDDALLALASRLCKNPHS